MSQTPLVLLYGRDVSLLETRKWVLEKISLQVITTHSLADAKHVLTSRKVDLFILCHSLDQNECDGALSLTRLLRPEVKILILNSGNSECASHQDFVLTAFAHPRALIPAVNDAIRHTHPQF